MFLIPTLTPSHPCSKVSPTRVPVGTRIAHQGKEMLFCVIPPHAMQFEGVIWQFLNNGGLDPKPPEECHTVSLTAMQVRTLYEHFPDAPLPRLGTMGDFRVIPLQIITGRRVETAVRNVLTTLVDKTGDVPLWENGRVRSRAVSGTNLRLGQMVLIPIGAQLTTEVTQMFKMS